MSAAINKKERQKVFSRLFWEYEMSDRYVEKVLAGKNFNKEKQKIFLRLLYSSNWYTLKNILSSKDMKEMLSENILKKIHIPSLREKYIYVRRFLF